MIRADIELTAAEFELTWHRLGLGRMPYPLAEPGAARGHHGDLESWRAVADPELATRLVVLARPAAAVDAIGHFGGPFRALAGADRSTGVLAVRGHDGYGAPVVRLARIRPTALVSSIVDILPPARPGYGASLSVPVGAAGNVALLTGGRIAGGQFGVTVTDRLGTRHRAETLVAWFDTGRGRYLVVRDREWLSLAPADNYRIADRVGKVLAAPWS